MSSESINLSNIESFDESFQEIDSYPLRTPNLSFDTEEKGKFIIQKIPKSTKRGPLIPASWRGPLKVLNLIIMVALLPTLFVAVPLYIKHYLYSGQLYPVGMSDMRLIDKKVSTIWCQKQLLHSNATFNAFRAPSVPKISDELIPVTMTRQLYLQDDMKEYWGFYLLEGSMVTVSACVRWPGASLIMIRGHKHLQECAYIGDDSSEELEEILRSGRSKLDNATLQKLIANNPSNRPNDMTRHLKGVKFHEPRPPALELNPTNKNPSENSEERDIPNAKALQKILDHIKDKQEKRPVHPKPNNIVAVPQLTHRHRETNVNQDEEKWFDFRDLDAPEENINKIYSELNKTTPQPTENKTEIKNITEYQLNETEKEIEWEVEEVVEEEQTSSEIFEDIFNKLSSLGIRGQNVLDKLNKKYADEEKIYVHKTTSTEAPVEIENPTHESNEDVVAQKKIDLLRQLLKDIIEDQMNDKKEKALKNQQRSKRELIIKQTLEKDLNEEDEKNNIAIEEEMEPDGIADDHFVINETSPNDMSGSEFWSSFSSSEEALLECEGLILNLPLNPSKACEPTENSKNNHDQVAKSNTITYRVPSNGYYFFVFNSENEIQTNYIRVKFDMQKTIYDLTKGAIAECENSTEKCAIPLSFLSGEKVILEIPVRDNDSLWNEEFVVISECEPRTPLYLLCVVAIPVLILIIAFQ